MMKTIVTMLFAGVMAASGCGGDAASREDSASPPVQAQARAPQHAVAAADSRPSLGERITRFLRRDPSTAELESVRQVILRVAVAGAPPSYVHRGASRPWKLTARFYENRDHQPAWVASRSRRDQIDGLLRALARAEQEAIEPALYDVPALRALERSAFSAREGEGRSDALADLDLRLTHAFVSYHSHLHGGRIDPSDVDPSWPNAASRAASDSLLEVALQEGRVEQALAADGFPPGYVRLREALATYRRLAAEGGWPRIDASALAPGDSSHAVAALRARLAITGDLAAAGGANAGGAKGGSASAASAGSAAPVAAARYDEAIVAGVERFQARHGLTPDGVAGAETIAQLNIPAEARVRQIELNMERWRWLPDDLGERYIEVNVPAFELHAHDAGHDVLSMKVVAGDEYHPTPVFSDKMTHVVFRPYWSIPSGIALEEKLPQIVKDREFLERDGLELVRDSGNGAEVVDPSRVDWSELAKESMAGYQLRQKPGPRNSLGLVKFMFPNRFNVYLHDTPADKLFAREERALSHGCVRVEKPALLAEFVLRDNEGWSRERIDAAMAGNETRTVELARAIPVHIVYWTAFAGGEGTIHFRDDVYGIDQAMAAVSEAAPGSASSSAK